MKSLVFFLLFSCAFVPMLAQTGEHDSAPVRLRSFNVVKRPSSISLQWEVACSISQATFDVQRSADGQNYITIHKFGADQLRCRDPFSYEDKTGSGTIFYRVRVGDLDGRYYSSKIAVVYDGKPNAFNIIALTPSIITHQAMLQVSAATGGHAQLRINDHNGNMLKQWTYSLIAGENQVSLSLGGLASGTYVISVTNAEGSTRSTRFIKQ